MKISERAQHTPSSPIRSLATHANVAKSRGVHVHHLNIGQPDIHSPQEFIDGVHNFNQKILAYDATNGNKSLLAEWCLSLNTQYNIGITQENMLITSGSSEALMFAFTICCDVDDEILVFDPTYANYSGFAALAGVQLAPVQCAFSTGFHLPPKNEITSQISTQTKAILVCNPNNPTGTVYTTDEMNMLIELCEKHNMFLIVDEVYREFVYDNRQPQISFHLAPKHESIIVVDSISKRYSLCGARIGCLMSFNKEIMQAASNLASTRVSSPTIEQEATAHMLHTISPTYLADTVAEYERRKNAIVVGLQSIPGVKVNPAEGGFYVLAELPVKSADDFCTFMLKDFSHNNETVFLAPASGFYIAPYGKSSVRIAFVVSVADIQRAVEVLRHALVAYSKK